MSFAIFALTSPTTQRATFLTAAVFVAFMVGRRTGRRT